MPWSSVTPILVWAAIFLPITVVLWIFPPRNWLTVLLTVLAYAAASFYCVLAINWAMVNYWLRLAPVILTIAVTIRMIAQAKNRPFFPRPGIFPLASVFVALAVLVGAVYVDTLVLKSYRYDSYTGQPVLLRYPLRYGMYVITNGGNGLEGLGMSDHYMDWRGQKNGASPATAYGVDMMKMRFRGWIGDGVMPNSTHKYEGFRDNVYSPCVGKVVFVEDGHPDVALQPASDKLGNRVVIQCYEYYVTLANLMNDSILVEVGQNVDMQNQLGQVGSSGDPAVPHLFIYATTGSWDETGQPVPLSFELRFHERNDILIPQ